MIKVTVFTTDYCPYCVRAKNLLNQQKIPFTEVDLTHNDELREQVGAKAKMRTVPIIYFGELLIGGFDDLNRVHQAGQLAQKMEEAAQCLKT